MTVGEGDRAERVGTDRPDGSDGEGRLSSGTELSCQRHRFSIPPGVRYFNCAYMSPLSRRAEAAGIRALRRKRAPVDLGPEDFFRQSDRLRELFARVLGAEDPAATARRVALAPAVSYGAAIVAASLEWPADANVVVVEEQFPSHVYPWRRRIRQAGGALRVVDRPAAGGESPAEDGDGPASDLPERWSERVVRSVDERTVLVALPHAHWTDGALLDLEAIGDRAREVGAALVIDATQSLGAHPFPFERIRPDAVLCAGYKWLLGPYSLGFAYLGERFADARPLEETWIGRRGSEDFAALVEYTDAYRDDASRFDVGERSNFLLAPVLVAALEEVLEWSVARIADRCRALNDRVASGARPLGFGSLPATERASNILGLRVPGNVEVDRVMEGLRARDVHVSRRGDSLRISPHVYNDGEDVGVLLEGLEAVTVRGAT